MALWSVFSGMVDKNTNRLNSAARDALERFAGGWSENGGGLLGLVLSGVGLCVSRCQFLAAVSGGNLGAVGSRCAAGGSAFPFTSH